MPWLYPMIKLIIVDVGHDENRNFTNNQLYQLLNWQFTGILACLQIRVKKNRVGLKYIFKKNTCHKNI